MVRIKKIRWIPILMIISQILLAGFVVYWLKSQYRDERVVLQEEIAIVYEESRSQVIDSMLFSHVVEPVLNDSVRITMITSGDSDSVVSARSNTTPSWQHVAFTRRPKSAMITINVPDTPAVGDRQQEETYAIAVKNQDFLIRSVKMIISHTGDTTSGKGDFHGFMPGNPDTALFRKVFMEKISGKNYGIDLEWSPDTLRKVEIVRNVRNHSKLEIRKNPAEMHFSSVLPDHFPRVRVSNEIPYLVGQIFPQILFGFILLVLTGSAFFFTNRSLKRQLILNSLRNDFVSNITHELKTPVSTVKVALEALKTFDKVSNPAITRDYLDMAGQEMNRLDQLISKVLDQSLIGEQSRIIDPQACDLKDIINNTLATLEPRLAARNATIRFEPAERLSPVPVDHLHFQGVITNLIDNSLKYGREYPEITIRLWQNDRSAFVEVGDNGPGIPGEHLGRVFDKFFRVPTGDAHTVKGYGLGLSFAALVMKQHRGSISVRNLDAGGCAFTLRFPLHNP
jgi:signal transduction histidine kinase